MQTQKQPLWTRNFTIITLGTVVSMLGNAISGFAIGLMVLDYTNSTFLFALFMVVYNLPKIIMPLIAGPYLDNFSRVKVIYTLDFISAALYAGIFLLLKTGAFAFGPFLALAFVIGTIDSVYQVAYESLYPTLVSEGNFSKAYSISSMLMPLSAVMVPVAAFLYGKIGLEPLFLFNAFTFLVAAIFETMIRAPESQIRKTTEKFNWKEYTREFREGARYIRSERGLLVITAFFCVTMFAYGSGGTLMLPYFKNTPELGVVWYTLVAGCGVAGRIIGGAIQYRLRYPVSKKFLISILVYIAASISEGVYLYTPIWSMMILSFVTGLLTISSYNIRISTTQSYVPNEFRGRFNGAFQMVCTFGTIMGQLAAGALAERFSPRLVILTFMALNFVSVFAIMLPGGKYVREVYNRDV